MKLISNEEVLISKKEGRTMSKRKLDARKRTAFTNRSEIRTKNSKLIEDIFNRSLNTVESSLEKIKFETNKLLLESEFCRNRHVRLKQKRKLEIEVNHLNKSARFKRLVDLIESKNSIQTTENNTKSNRNLNEFQPSLPIDDSSKLVLPIKPILKVDTDSPNLVNLTWDVINTLNQTDGSKYVKQENYENEEEMYSSIKEYEIYSYKLKLYKSNLQNDSNKWTKIGSVEPYLPPVKCTLSDFATNCKYFFTIRIKSKNNVKSEFSEVVSIVL